MNIRDTGKLEKLLQKLNFSQKNYDIALEYLSGEMADDSLLEGIEHQNFRQLGHSEMAAAWDFVDDLRRKEQERMPRCLKLFWAIGKSTAYIVWRTYMSRDHYREFQPGWMMEVLPKPAVAAIIAERSAYHEIGNEDVSWLCDLARSDPDTLEIAQELSGTPHGNMKVCIAGLLLCYGRDSKLIERQSALVIRAVLGAMDSVVPAMNPSQIQALCGYIERGSITAPVPVPFALTAKDALQVRNSDDYLTALLGKVCYLAQNADERIRRALRVFLALNPQVVLNNGTRMASAEFLEENFEQLLQDVPGGAATMILYLSFSRWWIDADQKKRLMLRCASGVKEALQHANANQHMGILELLPSAKNFIGDERAQICSILGKYTYSGKDELRDFLMGDGPLKDCRKELDGITVQTYSNPREAVAMLVLYRLNKGWDDFVCRSAVVLGLVFDGSCLDELVSRLNPEKDVPAHNVISILYGSKFDAELLVELVAALRELELPLSDVLTMCGIISDNLYNEKMQKELQAKVYLTVAKPENIPELTDTLKKGTVFARQTAINALYNLAPEHPEAKAGVLSAAGDSSKQIKESLVILYVGRPEWADDYKKLLTAKKAAERLIAVQVLGKLGHREELEAVLATEKNAKVADAIRSILGAPQGAPVGSNDDLAANLLKGNKLKKLTWLIEQPLPKLRKTDGSDADENIRNAILVSYCELGRIGRSETAAQLAADLDTGDLSKLAWEVYEHWYAAGAQTKHKWVLAFAAVYGGSAMTQRLKTAINDWPNHQRGAIACEAVMALALSPDPAALVIVDSISRKFKFRQVKQAAAIALENAANELGITAEELADRIVPDLGFGKDGKRVFDYGKRSFTVRLTPTLELEITNDQGKTVKNLPAPGKTDEPQALDAYEEFKNMKKQIKTTVTAQRARLESALSVLRCWDTDRWRALFVENPIMHQFAMSLIWGVYEDGTLTDTFRYMEDGSFNTVDEDEYELPVNAKIGLVHPVELDEETLSGWKQQLEDYEIAQSLDQLNRPVYTLDASRAKETALEDFGGKQLNGLSLSGKLLGLGWYRGSVQDGGVFYSFYREDQEPGIGVELRFSGSAVGYDDGENVTVYEAVFYRGTVRRGSYVYDEVKKEDIVPLGDIPVRYYSEIIHQLNRATASSTETNEGWRNDR